MHFIGGFRLDHEDLLALSAHISNRPMSSILREEREDGDCVNTLVTVEYAARRTKSALGILNVITLDDEKKALEDTCPHYSFFPSSGNMAKDESGPRIGIPPPEPPEPVDCILITRFDKRVKGDERAVEYSEKVDGRALRFLVENGLDEGVGRKKWVSLPKWRVPSVEDEFIFVL